MGVISQYTTLLVDCRYISGWMNCVKLLQLYMKLFFTMHITVPVSTLKIVNRARINRR